ncbi:NADH-quinone oxidoreductase subunit NuoE [Georgenia sp. 311]|uniref:NADH-quinone oxidoreductase subunit NuoE n=1 Tax=Georgenia wutianyii TaxID=2585135 RepID=A0ABX5VTE8_9MICO|nr:MULTISPECIES: NADH-quinone oxidoreductase subunit NuoE [Georgenia]QDB80285.1 NADH-quinone oxidoreductase subunit NuoE [Georgenia wutianyii]TNC19025.1 NADH-quinone oxidoreductase subunit NuoE [Georgenia sp. 311]
MSVTAYAPEAEERLRGEAAQIISRYPQARSALLPMLHLVQSEDGYVSARGIALCADVLGLTRAEVSAVATFYTQYKRHPNGEYTVGVCTNALCAVMGGDLIYERVSEHLGIGHDETTEDGKITLEQVECNAACDYAPVIVVNWEFFDNQTPTSAVELVDQLRAGRPVTPTRGAATVGTFKEISHVLAGFEDGRADEGPAAGPATLAGLSIAREHGWRAPSLDSSDGDASGTTGDVPDPYGSAERPPTTPDDSDPAGKRGPAGEGATAEEGKQ